ncbi:MAG: phosphoribosylanthranilate isomerase [Acidobacteriota bacterium]
MTEVKICGLTRPEDVRLACELGARWLGFNFAAGSPRRLSLSRAKELASEAVPGVARVGVFVDETVEDVRRAVDAASLDFVQVHRPLRPEDTWEMPRPVLAVVRVPAPPDRLAIPGADALARCRAVLFDTAAPGRDGGTGAVFDWSVLDRTRWPVPVMLGGGLDAGNVEAAIARVRPSAVDVASGVESAPGVKDPSRMERFFRAVEDADARLA